MKRLLLALVVFAALAVPVRGQNPENAASNPQKNWYEEELFLRNLSFGFSNPTAIASNPYTQLQSVQASYAHEEGNFKPIDGAGLSNLLDLRLYGTKKLENISFEGSIDYSVHGLQQSRWNGSVMQTERNPFVMADSLVYDSIPNNPNREIFNLSGGFAWQMSEKTILALRANYRVASKADQSDPRIEAKGARVTLNPGVEFLLNDRFSLGLSASAEIYHENVGSTVEDNIFPEHTIVFTFMELGHFEVKSDYGYYRRFSGHVYGGALQALFRGEKIQNLAELGGSFNLEEAMDGGSSYMKRGGDYEEICMSLKDRFQIRGDKILHNIMLNAGFLMGSSTWFKQNSTGDELGNNIWNIISSDVTQIETDIKADLAYRMDLLRAEGSHFSAQINGGVDMVALDEYPDEFYAYYSLANAGLQLTKRWYGNHVWFSLSADGAYHMSLSDLDISLPVSGKAAERIKASYFVPKYQYYASEYANAGVSAEAAYALHARNGNTYWIKLGVTGKYVKYLGDIARFDGGRQYYASRLSLVF